MSPRLLLRASSALLALAACPQDVNLTASDTNSKDSETTSSTSTVGSTGKTTTEAASSTDGPDTTTGPSSSSSTGDTTGKPSTSGSSSTSSSGSTTGTSSASSTEASTSTDGTGTGTDSSTTVQSTTDSSSSSGGEPVFGCPDGWTRKRIVTITNEPDKPLGDYQVKVKVAWDEDMSATFDDLRFTDLMGAPLPFWIEDYVAPVEAVVWVKVPTIAAATTTEVVMCYGNPAAASASNGTTTFAFFDGFDGNVLDPAKWVPTAPVSFSLGALVVANGAVYSKVPPVSFPNSLVEIRARLGPFEGGVYESTLGVASTQDGNSPFAVMATNGGYTSQNEQNMIVWQGKFQLGCCSSPSGGIMGIAADEAHFYGFSRRVDQVVGLSAWKKPIFLSLGYAGWKNSGAQPIRDLYVDWVLVRKFTSVEPPTSVGPEIPL